MLEGPTQLYFGRHVGYEEIDNTEGTDARTVVKTLRKRVPPGMVVVLGRGTRGIT